MMDRNREDCCLICSETDHLINILDPSNENIKEIQSWCLKKVSLVTQQVSNSLKSICLFKNGGNLPRFICQQCKEDLEVTHNMIEDFKKEVDNEEGIMGEETMPNLQEECDKIDDSREEEKQDQQDAPSVVVIEDESGIIQSFEPMTYDEEWIIEEVDEANEEEVDEANEEQESKSKEEEWLQDMIEIDTVAEETVSNVLQTVNEEEWVRDIAEINSAVDIEDLTGIIEYECVTEDVNTNMKYIEIEYSTKNDLEEKPVFPSNILSKFIVQVVDSFGIMKYECNICKKQTDLFSLRIHIVKDHMKKEPIFCDFEGCRRVFSSVHFQRQHSAYHLRKRGDNIHERSGEKGLEDTTALSCDFCEVNFASYNALLNHKKQIHPKTFFKCQFCSASFSQKTNLKKHSQICFEKKSFHCDICDTYYSSNFSLKNHRILNHNDSNFKESGSC